MKEAGFILLFTSVFFFGNTQSSIEYSTDDMVLESDIVVEGQVTGQRSFFHEDGLIYTTYDVSVHYLLKGQFEGDKLSFSSVGGVVGDEALKVCPSLHCREGQFGIFGLKQSESQTLSLVPVSADRSMMPIDPGLGMASDLEGNWVRLRDLRQTVGKSAKTSFRMVKDYPELTQLESAVTINNVTPLITQAGREKEITITGSGFGSTQGSGKVYFRWVIDPSTIIRHPAVEYISWSDTEIKVLVPEDAADGSVKVEADNGQTSAPSSQTLAVEYNIINVLDINYTYHIDHDSDGDGGYDFKYSTNTANGGVDFTSIPAAVDAVERATATWNAGTKFSIFSETACGTTSIQEPKRDGTNVITFDNNKYTLGGSVLGVCFSYYSKCGASEWEVVEMDVVLRRNNTGYTWEYGPGPPSRSEVDFESVVLHELGHGHQIGHCRTSGAVMYPSITIGTTKRNLTIVDDGAGSFAQSNSTGYVPPIIACGSPFNKKRQYLNYSSSNKCSAALPLELISFDGKANDKNVDLIWVTANEIHHDKIILQKGTFDEWEELETFGSQGLNGAYEYTDVDVEPGLHYYRLKIIDDQGNYDYSDVIAVEIIAQHTDVTALSQQGSIILEMIGLSGEMVQVVIYDLLGRPVYSSSFTLATEVATKVIETDNWNSGTYILSWRSASGNDFDSSKIFVR